MRRLFAFLCLFTATARAQTPPRPAPTPYFPSAAATIVLDLSSGRVLESKNARARLFPASTTKIMTCLVALERGNLNQIIRASPNAAATGESGIRLLAGENHTLRELIEAAMVHSANDACVAIAEGVGASQSEFVGWMNQKARDLGCRDTQFRNPHGLHDPNHYTTAHDLALIGRAALELPEFSRIARMKTATIGGNWKIGPRRVLINRNKLLFRWNQCDGLKTGYTRQAGNCLVASASQIDPATRKPWRLLAVALKTAPGRSYGDCQWLLQRAFATYQPHHALRGGEIVSKSGVKGGAFALHAVARRDLFLPLSNPERQTLTRRVKILPLAAPLQKGAVVGIVEYFANPRGAKMRRVAQTPLVAQADVPQTLLARAVPSLGNRFQSSDGVSLRTPIFLLGLFCCGAACLLLFKRHSHARRRQHPHLQHARLEPRNGANPTRRPRSSTRH